MPLLALALLMMLGPPSGEARGAVDPSGPFSLVLGIAQDGGYPQAGCRKPCCAAAWADPSRRRSVACLALVDPRTAQRWMIDATPDLRGQLRRLDETVPAEGSPGLAGVLLTHAHIGHYTGLMHLGHEAMGAREVPVLAMPRLRAFLAGQGPWDQLVRYRNVVLEPMAADERIALNDRLAVTPLIVPHRDEYSETVGFLVEGPRRSLLYLPDIDKWDRWDRRIEDVLARVDVAYLDGTFFADGELPHRSMAEIPHPFIVETIERLGPLPADERAKVRFIHLNHTNPALDPRGGARRRIEAAGFAVAEEGDREPL